jgi:hypothetical protein
MDKFNKLNQNTISRSDAMDEDEKVEQWMKTLINLFNFFVNLLSYIKAMCVLLVICKFGKFIMFDDG